MTKEEVLSKVRKLFELAGSPNEHEAALAACKARELLSRYNLSVADLPTDDMQKTISATETSLWVGKVLRNWVKGLLIYTARGFECDHVIRRRRGDPPMLTFIGTAADTEVASYTFQFLYRELNGLADRALPKLKRQNKGWSATSLRYAYLDGAVKRIGEEFRDKARVLKNVEQTACKDLVLAKERLIKEYMANTFSTIRAEYGRLRTVSAHAFAEGYQDAAGINIRPALTDENSDTAAVTA
jgi:hypothetical protein